MYKILFPLLLIPVIVILAISGCSGYGSGLSGAIATVTPLPAIVATYPPPSDIYYSNMFKKIITQKLIWQDELGYIRGRMKTVNWLNNRLPGEPLPDEIKNAVREAEINQDDSRAIIITFRSGVVVIANDPVVEDWGRFIPHIVVIALVIVIMFIIILIKIVHRFNKND